MSPSPQRRKGFAAEREVADLLAQATGWPVRRRLQEGRRDDTGDLEGLPDTTVQVRNYANVAEGITTGLAALRTQHERAGTRYAVLLHRRRGGQWIAVLDLDGFVQLLLDAAQGGEP